MKNRTKNGSAHFQLTLPEVTRVPEIEKLHEALNRKELSALLKCYDNFMLTVEKYKDDQDLCSSIITYLSQHRDEFDFLFKTRFDLTYLAERVSREMGEELIHFIVNDSEEFQRLVKNKSDLEILARTYPNYACIFSQPSLETANAVIMDVEETKMIFSVLMLDRQENPVENFLDVLPPETLLLIAVYAKDHPHISNAEVYRLAGQYTPGK